MGKYYLAVDIGASSGRHILGHLENGKIELEEIYRFENGMDHKDGKLLWNVDRLFGEILNGMKKCKEQGKIPVSMAIDTWAVDYVLLDEKDRILGDTYGYRDHRTDGMDAEVAKILPETELYAKTGIQKQIFNTIYQLMAEKQISVVQTVPLKYSLDLESQLKQAVVKRDREAYDRILEQIMAYCVEEPHHPDEIREAWARLVVAMIAAADSMGRVTDHISMRHIVGELSQAISWQRIRELMQNFYDAITGGQDQPESVSLLVKRALSMIETYYSQGITLEELAERLCVTDEYLSTLIKKETGISFTETVRKMRIERIKELLLHSSLKLNQIAEMVGYSDPKYMSKVFKEEVGMLPAQFRKQNH